MPQSQLSIHIPRTSYEALTHGSPPAYTVSPHTPDPRLLALALRDFRMNQDPAYWGTRKTSAYAASYVEQLTGLCRWIAWLGDLMSVPTPLSWSTAGTPPAYMAMGHAGAL